MSRLDEIEKGYREAYTYVGEDEIEWLIDRCRKLEMVLDAGKRMVFIPSEITSGNAITEFLNQARKMMVEAIKEVEDSDT